GGANHPFQGVAAALLEPRVAIQESLAIQKHFGAKRSFMLGRLKELGIGVDAEPAGAFRSEEHTSELQSRGHLVCRLLLGKKKTGRLGLGLPPALGLNWSSAPGMRALEGKSASAVHPSGTASPAAPFRWDRRW